MSRFVLGPFSLLYVLQLGRYERQLLYSGSFMHWLSITL